MKQVHFLHEMYVSLTLALSEVICSDLIPLPAGAVKPTRVVQTELLTTSVREVAALIHVSGQKTDTVKLMDISTQQTRCYIKTPEKV